MRAGWATRGDPEEIARREAMLTLTEVGWGADHPTYRQLFTNLYIPEGTAEQVDWFNEMQKVSCLARKRGEAAAGPVADRCSRPAGAR